MSKTETDMNNGRAFVQFLYAYLRAEGGTPLTIGVGEVPGHDGVIVSLSICDQEVNFPVGLVPDIIKILEAIETADSNIDLREHFDTLKDNLQRAYATGMRHYDA